ncbi:MAG: hypothetical protein MZW92_54000 [Comamonadaceae bacterium]|nr:hypothetical protein [Comamonadaceae bacterium]
MVTPDEQALARSARLVNALVERMQRDGQAPRLVQTHISWVLLAGDHAWKIKKPVRFGFLDFSTPAARRHFCHEELRLNRRLAPGLYLAVEPIRGELQRAALRRRGRRSRDRREDAAHARRCARQRTAGAGLVDRRRPDAFRTEARHVPSRSCHAAAGGDARDAGAHPQCGARPAVGAASRRAGRAGRGSGALVRRPGTAAARRCGWRAAPTAARANATATCTSTTRCGCTASSRPSTASSSTKACASSTCSATPPSW